MKKMKNLIKITVLFVVILFTACDYEPIIYDDVNGQLGVGFSSSSSAISLIVPEEGASVTALLQATQLSSSDRTYELAVDESLSTGSSEDYTVGTLTIPANSYDGTLEVTFGNFTNLPELTELTLVLNLVLSTETAKLNSQSVTFTYLKKIICNDFELTINEDGYGSERNWEITDSNGNVVLECANFGCPYGDISGGEQNKASFSLPNGVYTFTIFDSYGDGLFDGVTTGTYELKCSLILHASGSGNFGSFESTEFFVNQ